MLKLDGAYLGNNQNNNIQPQPAPSMIMPQGK